MCLFQWNKATGKKQASREEYQCCHLRKWLKSRLDLIDIPDVVLLNLLTTDCKCHWNNHVNPAQHRCRAGFSLGVPTDTCAYGLLHTWQDLSHDEHLQQCMHAFSLPPQSWTLLLHLVLSSRSCHHCPMPAAAALSSCPEHCGYPGAPSPCLPLVPCSRRFFSWLMPSGSGPHMAGDCSGVGMSSTGGRGGIKKR